MFSPSLKRVGGPGVFLGLIASRSYTQDRPLQLVRSETFAGRVVTTLPAVHVHGRSVTDSSPVSRCPQVCMVTGPTGKRQPQAPRVRRGLAGSVCRPTQLRK